jgi:hypothetical protein
MALYHVEVGKILKGQHKGGSTGFAQYLQRENPTHATQHVRYLSREGVQGKDDLVASGADSLPSWAQNGTHFFAMADRYERANGVVGRAYEIALPRELTPAQRHELVDDIRHTYFIGYAHVWAIHNPRASDGGEQPHAHILVSERQHDGVARSPSQFFRRANLAHPERGGAAKPLVWNHRDTLGHVRHGIATLTNAALERAGMGIVVTAKSLKALGHTRTPEAPLSVQQRTHLVHGRLTAPVQAMLERHETLHRDYHPLEALTAMDEWHHTREREGLRDLSRAHVRDHVRQRFLALAQSHSHEHVQARTVLREVGHHLQTRATHEHTKHAANGDTMASRTPSPRQKFPFALQPWMGEAGGAEQLSPSGRAQAERSYSVWRHQDKYSFDDYVLYVQTRWAEEKAQGLHPDRHHEPHQRQAQSYAEWPVSPQSVTHKRRGHVRGGYAAPGDEGQGGVQVRLRRHEHDLGWER